VLRRQSAPIEDELTGTNSDISKTPNFTVEKRSANHYRLCVCGSFAPGWLARLSAGLSDHQVSILRGAGRQIQGSYWEAAFEINMAASAVDPRKLDYRSFVEGRAATHHDESFELRDYSIAQPEDQNKGVWVEVKGADKIGFLRNILKTFAFYSLFPSEIEIETTGANVCDRFLLHSIGGTAPSANALLGVRELLDDFCVR